MNIQSVLDVPIADKEGRLTPPWRDFLSQFFIQMQQNFSNEGYKLPQQTAANILLLNTAKSIGNLLYDSDNNQFKVNINGTYKVVQVA